MAKKDQTQKSKGEYNSSVKTNIAYIDGASFFAKPVQYAEVEGLAMLEGDIILGTVSEVEKKTNLRGQELRGEVQMSCVITGDEHRWPDCTVPYTIDAGLANQVRVTDAIAHWVNNTNMRFVLRTAANSAQYPDWVTFRTGTGCSSYVGRIGGQQYINLAPGCTTGNAIHEIGHTVGLWHEQSREDRDSFVTIHWDKIMAGYENNFSQQISDGDDIGNYDYGSIMHYGRDAFSIDGSDTITPLDPTATIGQRVGLSAGDIAAVNSIYTCGMTTCLPGPKICLAGPNRCPAPPVQICKAMPKPVCPPRPTPICPPVAKPICPPVSKPVCPPFPKPFCPPSIRITCPPVSKPSGCFPAPRIVPGPIRPEYRGRFMSGLPNQNIYGYDPYGREAYGYPYAQPQYADPYGYSGNPYYDNPGYYEDWTAYEYSDPYQYGQPYGYPYPYGPYNPYYRG